MKNPFSQLKGSTRLIVNSTLPLLIAILLTILVANFGIPRINDLRSKITQAESDKSTLLQKLSILQTSSTTAEQNVSVASSALPTDNSSLAAIDQLKSLAAADGVVVSNIKVGSPTADSSGLTRADISFNVDGAQNGIVAFINGISGLAPVSVVGKIKLVQLGGAAQAQTSISTFWSPSPAKIPAVTQPITDLTSGEKTLLAQISALKQPTSIIFLVPAQVTGGRANPFSP